MLCAQDKLKHTLVTSVPP